VRNNCVEGARGQAQGGEVCSVCPELREPGETDAYQDAVDDHGLAGFAEVGHDGVHLVASSHSSSRRPQATARSSLHGWLASALPSCPTYGPLRTVSTSVNAGLTLPHHSGRTEDVNIRTKRIMRQMRGLAGFGLIGHHILLH
jgi:hypothetical protein